MMGMKRDKKDEEDGMLFYFILFTEWLILNFQEHD
jgi:hypothetical protein